MSGYDFTERCVTTIAYRDGVLAADRRVSRNDVSVGARCKIAEVHGPAGHLGWVAVSGWPADRDDAAMWLSKWPDIGEPPKRIYEGEAGGLFLTCDGTPHVIGGSRPFEMGMQFFATGSGWEIAMGAMAMGAAASLAVEIASRYDHATGDGVDTVQRIRT